MSELLKQAKQLTAKVINLTDEQKKVIAGLEQDLSNLDIDRTNAKAIAEMHVKDKTWTQVKADEEVKIANAHIDAQQAEIRAKINGIDPTWTDTITEAAKRLAAQTAVKGLEMLGGALGFLGRAYETAKQSASKSNTGAFVAPEKPNVLKDLLKS